MRGPPCVEEGGLIKSGAGKCSTSGVRLGTGDWRVRGDGRSSVRGVVGRLYHGGPGGAKRYGYGDGVGCKS